MKVSPLVLLLSLPFLLPGCKRKELEAELARVKDQLAAVESERDAEKRKNQQLSAENQSLKEKIAELEAEIRQLTAQIEDLAKKAGVTAKELAELRAEKAKREKELQVYKDLFAKLKAMIDAGTIEVEFRKGRLVVKLSNAILFDSGRTDLKEEGKAALANLVPALKSVGKRDFLVAGHTDNVPIKTARFKSNWELSTARAVTVVKYLVEQGYPPTQLGAAGFAEYDPIADNSTEEGRAKNRRIEIILMPNLGEIPGLRKLLKG
ncbi:MAG: chemotaxis protein MotB [Deltaproteobacteria bacterium]|nr:MAG: chemotaxis protein MotB [Deltaproteobacteria bacterium]